MLDDAPTPETPRALPHPCTRPGCLGVADHPLVTSLLITDGDGLLWWASTTEDGTTVDDGPVPNSLGLPGPSEWIISHWRCGNGHAWRVVARVEGDDAEVVTHQRPRADVLPLAA